MPLRVWVERAWISIGGPAALRHDVQQEKYRKDLEGCVALMREFEQREIRAGLYFPLLGAWRELLSDPK